MVGHSGMIEPTVRAVETVDQCLGQIVDTWRKQDDRLNLIVTADHGNAEKMFDERTGQPHTAHTSNLVPLIVVSKKWKTASEEYYEAGLRDIAPTILNIMGIAKPKAMTGKSLV
jgi:2,3-bisphosphoglycerate-independent phosphoglycerate mutase